MSSSRIFLFSRTLCRGLGKTRSAIAAAVVYREDWPVLIVCPSSAKHHWQAELVNLLSPHTIEPRDITLVENANQPLASNDNFKIAIISYGLITKLADKLKALSFNVVIADESHYLKNSRAKRTQRLVPLLIESRRAILLSGTPALSRPIELFTQLHALDSDTWKDERQYGKRYCKMKRGPNGAKPGFGQEYKGASNTRELHVLLTNSLMIRRLKKDILHQLPKKVRQVIKVNIDDDETKVEFR